MIFLALFLTMASAASAQQGRYSPWIQDDGSQVSYIVPAGHYVRLISTVSGTGSTAIISRVEETLN